MPTEVTQKRLTIAVVLRFFGSTPTILNPEGTAWMNDPEGHGIMRPFEIYNDNGVGVSTMFGKHPVPTRENPLTIYLDTNKNKGDGKGVLFDVSVVESTPGTEWKADMTGEKGKTTPVDYPWSSTEKGGLIDRTLSFAFKGRPEGDDASKERVETGVLGIYREDPALRVEIPLKLVYRGPAVADQD